MSVKRLEVVDGFHDYISSRMHELFKDLDHARHSSFKDIVVNLEYSHKVVKELLQRAKKYQARDMETKNKKGENK
jgi:hypothetical protein